MSGGTMRAVTIAFSPIARLEKAPSVEPRTISGTSTGLLVPLGIALDNSRNIYVANCGTCNNSVTGYAEGAHGNVAPIQTISGSNTGLSQTAGIALDSSRNIYGRG